MKNTNYIVLMAKVEDVVYNSGEITTVEYDDQTILNEIFNINTVAELKRYSELEEFISFMIIRTKRTLDKNFETLLITSKSVIDNTTLWSINIRMEKQGYSYEIIEWTKVASLLK